MILIDRLDEFVGRLSPGKLGGNRNQRNELARDGLAFAVDRSKYTDHLGGVDDFIGARPEDADLQVASFFVGQRRSRVLHSVLASPGIRLLHGDAAGPQTSTTPACTDTCASVPT